MEALKDRNHLIKTKPNNAMNIILQKCVFGVLCVTLLLRTDNRGLQARNAGDFVSSSTFAFPIVLARFAQDGTQIVSLASGNVLICRRIAAAAA